MFGKEYKKISKIENQIKIASFEITRDLNKGMNEILINVKKIYKKKIKRLKKLNEKNEKKFEDLENQIKDLSEYKFQFEKIFEENAELEKRLLEKEDEILDLIEKS